MAAGSGLSQFFVGRCCGVVTMARLESMTMDSFLFNYTVGSIPFLAGLYFAKKAGVIDLKSPAKRKLIWTCIFAWAALFVIQGALQFLW